MIRPSTQHHPSRDAKLQGVWRGLAVVILWQIWHVLHAPKLKQIGRQGITAHCLMLSLIDSLRFDACCLGCDLLAGTGLRPQASMLGLWPLIREWRLHPSCILLMGQPRISLAEARSRRYLWAGLHLVWPHALLRGKRPGTMMHASRHKCVCTGQAMLLLLLLEGPVMPLCWFSRRRVGKSTRRVVSGRCWFWGGKGASKGSLSSCSSSCSSRCLSSS